MVSAKITRDGFVKSDFGFQRKTKTDLPIFSVFESKALFGRYFVLPQQNLNIRPN